MLDTKTLRRKLAEYDTLPSIFDDLTANLAWADANPPPLLPRVCRECGSQMEPWQMTWCDVQFALDRGCEIPDELRALCLKCAPENDGE